MHLTKELFQTTKDFYSAIQEQVVNYCKEMKFEHIPDKEDVRLDNGWGMIGYSWSVNESCHCHPEYVDKKQAIKIEDFLTWAEYGEVKI